MERVKLKTGKSKNKKKSISYADFLSITDKNLKSKKIQIKKKSADLFTGILKFILAWQQRPIPVEFGACCSLHYDLVRLIRIYW